MSAEKMRWRVAYLLDHSHWFCWTDLVAWVLEPSRDNFNAAKDSGRCRQRSCYCGKFKEGQVDQ